MADNAGTFERLAIELSRALEPVSSWLSDKRVLATLAELGVKFPPALLANAQFNAARSAITNSAGQLRPLVGQLETAIAVEDSAGMAAGSLALVAQAARVIDSLTQLGPALTAASPSLPGITAAQVAELVSNLPRKLQDFLVAEVIDLVRPVGTVLELLGVVERVFRPGDPTNPTKPDYDQVTVHLDRVLPAAINPTKQLEELYQWGGGAFDAVTLFTVLETALARLGLPVLLRPASGSNPPVLEAFALDVRPTSSGSPPGLQIDLVMPAGIDATLPFAVSPPAWMATVTTKGAMRVGTTGTLRPPFQLELSHPAGEVSGAITVGLRAQPAEPIVILGKAGGSRLEFRGLIVDAGLKLQWDPPRKRAAGELFAKGTVSGGKLVIDASQGDGFLTKILGGGRMESNFEVGLTFDPATGFRFQGSGTLEIQIPVHVQLGPVELQSVYLIAQLAGASVPLELSAGLKADLGPLKASVDRLGVLVDLGFPPGGGNLGPAELSFAFKPPNGVGLVLDAGVIKGGGFLYIDVERGEYAGALELTFSEVIALHAIGLITTKMPDGSKGFSLLIIITAEFGSGIQIGFGFTLLAVGGLLGLNRTMKLQPLMEGIRTGAVNSIMFPQDVVANAPKIISDLRIFFPAQQDTFLIGPMAKLGWGTPTLISLSLGVIIEIPGNIAILGVLKVALPTEDLALLVLQVNFAGAIEFDKKRMYFFASLFESRVLFITIDGEMGLLVATGDQANFVVPVGGFHPQFSPPPLPFPNPRRVAINLINTDVARIRVEGYFAVTSNTAQFGARADLFFGLDELNVQGDLSFDALFQFSPFHFIITMSASFSVNVFGFGLFSVSIQGELEGPAKWRAHGEGSITLLFFDISADFDVTWGESRDTTLPPIAVMPMLKGEFEKAGNWRAFLPAGNSLLVSLRKLPEQDTGLVLHPVGILRVSQRLLPLEMSLAKVGNQKPNDVNRLTVDVVANGLSKYADTLEQFAPAQFQNMTDADKLSRPAFGSEPGGLDLSAAGQQLNSSQMVKRVVRYEVIIIDSNFRRFLRFIHFPTSLFTFFMEGSTVARSELAQATKKLFQPFDERVSVQAETYSVVFQATSKAYSGDSIAFPSEASAREYLKGQVSSDPNLADAIHVVPSYERVG